ncbi:MAG: sigma 54-interacting transcriptional regulator [Syntrophomonadaceae bacterium]|nr:sigma 54-interacting transcriptional regulator [Syntrophomonadaceae bacterium]
MIKSVEEGIRIWRSFRETGECEGISISPEVRDSWLRSEKFGVNPYKTRCDVVLTEMELEIRKARNRALLTHASAMMANLRRYTDGSGYLFSLADSRGCILARTGDREALDYADGQNLIEGSNWSEKVMGTTSGSVATVENKPVQLVGYEYWCLMNPFVISSSCPILDIEDKVIGVLSVGGPYHPINRHTMGMVVAASRALERQLALQTAFEQSEMENLYKTIVMESLSDGVLTLDRKGRVMVMNKLAAQILGIDPGSTLNKTLKELMPPYNEPLFQAISENRELIKPLEIRRKYDRLKTTVSCIPLVGKNNQVLGTVVILQPIQKYKRPLEKVCGARAGITFNDIIGNSSELNYALRLAEIASKSDSNVLLLGESGVGKEVFAQAIHNASRRRDEPFIAINCAAVPRELISSELFGYEEGAFTGARKGGNPGKLELADQGTLFLDEIGEMPLDLQGSLLRFLEEGNIMRLGGREVIPVDVRIIAASNKNLKDEVMKGRFRLDLYYRLKVIDIEIPPLRMRKDDIPGLVEHFVKTIGSRLGRKITGIDPGAMEILLNYDWPGNVRELKNVIERAVNIAGGDVLTVDDLPPDIKEDNLKSPLIWEQSLNKDEIEKRLIMDCLRKHNGNRNLAAKELGISRATIFRKIKKYSIN